MSKKTIVLGASLNELKYSNQAIHLLTQAGHDVIAVGRSIGQIGEINIQQELPKAIDNLDTVTLYLNPTYQPGYYNDILKLKPKRIIFNPGTENDVLAHLAQEAGIATENACTLVLLRTQQY
mgnify:CR=1 FL=1